MDISSIKTQRIVLFLSLFNACFWLVVQWVDVYQWKAAAALYELMALFMLFLFAVLFILSIVQWIKQKAAIRSLALLSLAILLITIIILWMRE
ncbi:MAG: hypothetical protein GXC73_00290 [Chitinophagaceae bacterium]|nr:hypothetical protein [Chitinophagaceae bacterium]